MKRILPFAVPLAALGIAALVGLVRRDALAETPGAVVERFLRHLAHDRPEKARELMTPALASQVGAPVMERWEREAAEGLGELDSVRGETEWISGDEAEASGVLEAEGRERRLRFLLERGGNGGWAIARLDRFWGETALAGDDPESVRVHEDWRERGRVTSAAPRNR